MSGNNRKKRVGRRRLLEAVGSSGVALTGVGALGVAAAGTASAQDGAQTDGNGDPYCHTDGYNCADTAFDRGTRVRVIDHTDGDAEGIYGSIGTWTNCCTIACGPAGAAVGNCDADCSNGPRAYPHDEGIVRGECVYGPLNDPKVRVEWVDPTDRSAMPEGEVSHIVASALEEA